MGITVGVVSSKRGCSRTACGRVAVATLTYNYADSTAVLGPLATYAEPHTYDLCGFHAERLTAPQGWEVVRLVTDFSDAATRTDDLTAVADAVRDDRAREAATRHPEGWQSRDGADGAGESRPRRYPERLEPLPWRDEAVGGSPQGAGGHGGARVGHLRVLRDGESWGEDR